MSTAIIILAAGNSSRMGTPKQSLSFNGRTLLEVVTDAALQTLIQPVIVILGAHADKLIHAESCKKGLLYLVNENWHEGMASSIAFGVRALLSKFPGVKDVIISVCDQPYIDSEVFKGLADKRLKSGMNIIAAKYGQTIGTPVLFNKKYFYQLVELKGDNGAKQIVKMHPEDVETVPFPLGHMDIDTDTDYHNLIRHK
jgi:molybdenum cofactor cytidylyltransferase